MSDNNDSNDDNQGRVEQTSGQDVLRFERFYHATLAEVWSAITDSEQLSRWLFPASIEPGPGGTVAFDYADGTNGRGSILIWDEPKLLEYEWFDTSTDSTWRIRFELSTTDESGDESSNEKGGEEGRRVLLTFTHFLPKPRDPKFGAGWHWHLDRLAVLLDDSTPPQVESDEAFEALMISYSASAESA